MSIASEITRINNNIASAYTAVNNKGGTLPVTQNSANLATAINSIEGGGQPVLVEPKDVNFYDYDGTIVNSYTASEFASLTELPANPTHTGLTAQGWNWSLSDAKTYVSTYGKLNIGQMYITSDGKTRIYIHLEEGRLSPYLGICVDGSVTVDWGDGSSTDTVTGSSTSTIINTQHTYSSKGDYVITIDPSSGSIFSFGGQSSNSVGSCILWNNLSEGSLSNEVYQNAIRKLELGTGIRGIGSLAFFNCHSLQTITMPNEITTFTSDMFQKCYSLQSITIPNSITTIRPSTFYYCYSLQSIIIPNSVTAIQGSAFRNCSSLKTFSLPNRDVDFGAGLNFSGCSALSNVIIPNGVTTIGTKMFSENTSLSMVVIPSSVITISANAFYNCRSIAYYDFSNHISIPELSNTNAFTGIASDCKIIVPDNLYNNWKAASGWSTYANYIIKASEV